MEKCITPVFFKVIARLVKTVTALEFSKLVRKCFLLVTQACHLCMNHLQTKVLRLVHDTVLDHIHLYDDGSHLQSKRANHNTCLLGYDHMEPEGEKAMLARQEEILNELGYLR